MYSQKASDQRATCRLLFARDDGSECPAARKGRAVRHRRLRRSRPV